MEKIKVAYQGQPGAFSEIAIQKYFAALSGVVTIGQNTFKQVFEAVKDKKADYAMVPIENTLAGSIHQNYDLLKKYSLFIIGEIYLCINHNLLVIPAPNISLNKRLRMIKKVYSHPVALAQCEQFFINHPWIKPIQAEDTAGSAKDLSESVNLNEAAIASRLAGRIYKLKILKSNIETNKKNFTRFVVISKKKNGKRANKVSLVFSLSHKPGSLFKSLEAFAREKINLSKIESRPILGRPFEYLFYLDFEINNLKKCQEAIKELKKYTHYFKTLGYYQKGKTFVS